jgi:hypothetical protein
MIRMASLAILVIAACSSCSSKSAESKDQPSTPPASKDKVAVPGGGNEVQPTATGDTPDDPKKHIQPDEGTLDVGKPDCKAGSEATATIKVTPGAGFHVSTDFPSELKLDPPAGVKLAKATQTAGKGQKGDAETFDEKGLSFAVKATPEKAGNYEIKGWFKFGVCDKESCHPKRQPITIVCAAT